MWWESFFSAVEELSCNDCLTIYIIIWMLESRKKSFLTRRVGTSFIFLFPVCSSSKDGFRFRYPLLGEGIYAWPKSNNQYSSWILWDLNFNCGCRRLILQMNCIRPRMKKRRIFFYILHLSKLHNKSETHNYNQQYIAEWKFHSGFVSRSQLSDSILNRYRTLIARCWCLARQLRWLLVELWWHIVQFWWFIGRCRCLVGQWHCLVDGSGVRSLVGFWAVAGLRWTVAGRGWNVNLGLNVVYVFRGHNVYQHSTNQSKPQEEAQRVIHVSVLLKTYPIAIEWRLNGAIAPPDVLHQTLYTVLFSIIPNLFGNNLNMFSFMQVSYF